MKNTMKNIDALPSRKEKPYTLNDEQVFQLIGATIRLALDDYFKPMPQMPKDTKIREIIAFVLLDPTIYKNAPKPEGYKKAMIWVHNYQEWRNNKATAELYFNSRAFKLTNIDKDYLFRTYKKMKGIE